MIASPTSIYNILCDAGLIAHQQNTLITNKKHFLLWSPPNRHNDVIWDKCGIKYYFKQKQVCNLVEYNRTITADHYQHIICCALPSIEALFPWPNFYFQQAGRLAPNSPDLSLIKNLWAIINKRIKSLNPSSQAAMQMFIFNKWKSISPKIC